MYGQLIKPDGKSIALRTQRVLVGSAEHCNLRIQAPSIAAHHCALVTAGGRWHLKQIDQGAHVTVNGARVEQHTLHPGDVIGIGMFHLQIQYDPTSLAGAPSEAAQEPQVDPDRHGERKLAPWVIPGAVVGLVLVVIAIVGALQPSRHERGIAAVTQGRSQLVAGHHEEAHLNFQEARSLLNPLSPEYESLVDHEVEALIGMRNYAAAAKIEEARGHDTEALRLYELARDWRNAGRIHSQKEQHAAAAEAYAKARDWEDAGKSYELAGNRAEAALSYERSFNWMQAADLYAALQDTEKAALLYERGGAWRRAADLAPTSDPIRKAELYVAAAREDPGVEVRLLAARNFKAGENDDRAKEQYLAAAKLAIEYRNFEKIISIHDEMGASEVGLRTVIDLAGRLYTKEELGEAWNAYLTAGRAMEKRQAESLHVDEEMLAIVYRQIATLRKEREAYPKIDLIEGVNHYTTYESGGSIYRHTTISGSVRNDTNRHIAEVSIRIKLFIKNRDEYLKREDRSNEHDAESFDPLDWNRAQRSIPEHEKAGYTETIVVREIAPGASQPFFQQLDCSIPYQLFSHPMFGLKLGPAISGK